MKKYQINKMMYLIIAFLLFMRLLIAQQPDIIISGNEVSKSKSSYEIIHINSTPTFAFVETGDLVFEIHNISERKTGFDFQSNASTQQFWIDYNNPNNLHAFFTFSEQAFGWSDRTCLYFGSSDRGETWFEMGRVPITSRSGFPAIYGSSNGEGVLSNHNNYFSNSTHTSLSIDETFFGNNFTHYDPGIFMEGPLWPRLTITPMGRIILASSSGQMSYFFTLIVNSFDPLTGQFSGWQIIPGRIGEQYDLSVSPAGKIGLAYTGEYEEVGDVLYRESTDGGLNWSNSKKVFDRDDLKDTTIGVLHGVSINFYNEDPCITYEVCKQIFSKATYYRTIPNEIHFWSPKINNGVPVVIADSSNVPYYPHKGTNDVYVPLCRPVIGRADNGFLFIAFSATTGDVFPSPDTTSYCATYFMYSSDGGDQWSRPAKITPNEPLYDWRYPSIAEVTPVIDNTITIHIVMQGDSIPGSTLNASGMPVGVTAQFFHFFTDIVLSGIDDDNYISNIFSLDQNYPNPFNPNTVISYQLPVTSQVSLKVYDILGREIATLVNEEKPAGRYEVEFDATSLSSGIYFYEFVTEASSSIKKMILLK